MSKIEEAMKAAYLKNGGDETGWTLNRGAILEQYRTSAAVNAALEAANKPVDVNDLIRDQLNDRRDDGLRRFFPNLTGDAA